MTDQIIKKRYASLAALLSLVSPGMGHLYAGKWQQAIIIPFSFLLIPALLGWSGLIFMTAGMYLLIISVVVFYLVVIGSAIWQARKRSGLPLNRTQRWYFYILFLVVIALMNTVVGEYRGKLFAYEPFHIPSESMLPNLLAGDYIIVDTYAYHNKQVEAGDVVVFEYPRDRSIKYVNRVIGKGGDHVAYYNKILYLNNKPVVRELIEAYTSIATQDDMVLYRESVANKNYSIVHMTTRPAVNAEYVVPDGRYFVMGDNRDNSNDSRYWGVFPDEYLSGKAVTVWFSIDNEMNVRKERIGLRL